jgi:hypothetical protein
MKESRFAMSWPRNRRGQVPGTAGASKTVLLLLRDGSKTAKCLARAVYGNDDFREVGRIYVLIQHLRKKRHCILLDGERGQPGRRYVLNEIERNPDTPSPRSDSDDAKRGAR